MSKKCVVFAYRHEHSCTTKALAEPVAHRSTAFVSAIQPDSLNTLFPGPHGRKPELRFVGLLVSTGT
jgi:hypothetical protein